MGLFDELKRRNVFRVGIAYLVLGWVVLQAADVIFPILQFPDWTISFVAVLAILGFPLALFFAWAFELTPEGLKRDHEVDRSESIAHVTGRKLDFAIIGLLVVALGFVVWDSYLSEPGEVVVTETPAETVETTPVEDAPTATASIAVLPFVNMSADKDQEYFSDGISEELLNLLARVPGLKVAGRTSSFAFRGKDTDLREIGAALNVSTLLEGSVRKSGNTLRITAQLINVADGFHLWSDSYDRELTDVFAIQDEISAAIVQALKTKLGLGSLVAAAPSEVTFCGLRDGLQYYLSLAYLGGLAQVNGAVVRRASTFSRGLRRTSLNRLTAFVASMILQYTSQYTISSSYIESGSTTEFAPWRRGPELS